MVKERHTFRKSDQVEIERDFCRKNVKSKAKTGGKDAQSECFLKRQFVSKAKERLKNEGERKREREKE